MFEWKEHSDTCYIACKRNEGEGLIEKEREKDSCLAFNQLGHWTLVEGRNNFDCKGKFNMPSVFLVAIVVEKIPVYRWVLMGLGGEGGWGV